MLCGGMRGLSCNEGSTLWQNLDFVFTFRVCKRTDILELLDEVQWPRRVLLNGGHVQGRRSSPLPLHLLLHFFSTYFSTTSPHF